MPDYLIKEETLNNLANDDYYFIKATSNALGVKDTEATVQVIPNLT